GSRAHHEQRQLRPVARAAAGAPRAVTDVPLFPLHTVLFPDGRLALRVFERRYVDMVAACLKADSPFGVCLIKRGSETGPAAEPQEVGTLAHIVQCDLERAGILRIVARGAERFRVRA